MDSSISWVSTCLRMSFDGIVLLLFVHNWYRYKGVFLSICLRLRIFFILVRLVILSVIRVRVGFLYNSFSSYFFRRYNFRVSAINQVFSPYVLLFLYINMRWSWVSMVSVWVFITQYRLWLSVCMSSRFDADRIFVSFLWILFIRLAIWFFLSLVSRACVSLQFLVFLLCNPNVSYIIRSSCSLLDILLCTLE